MQPTHPRTPARTTSDLIMYAEAHGIAVLWADQMQERGRWVPSRRCIIVRDGMSQRRTRATLAHEIGHAVWDVGEDRAWEHAAEMLVDCAEYEQAESVCPSAGAMAVELGVTVEVVWACRQLIDRAAA